MSHSTLIKKCRCKLFLTRFGEQALLVKQVASSHFQSAAPVGDVLLRLRPWSPAITPLVLVNLLTAKFWQRTESIISTVCLHSLLDWQ